MLEYLFFAEKNHRTQYSSENALGRAGCQNSLERKMVKDAELILSVLSITPPQTNSKLNSRFGQCCRQPNCIIFDSLTS
jgi:hypothetical protein